MTRDQILDILAELPARYWPVFLLDLIYLHLFHAEAWASTGGFAMVGVTKTGRIRLMGVFVNDAPDETDWTRHARREPWAPLDPQAIAALIEALDGKALDCTAIIPLLDCLCLADTPALLNSS